MDEGERKKKPPSLPPDYVSLAQLRERWLQKKQEEKLKQEEKQREDQNRSDVKDETVIEEGIENGKKVQQSGDENEHKKMNRISYQKQKQSSMDGKRENPNSENICYSEDFEGVKIITKNKSKLGESSRGGLAMDKTASVNIAEVLPGKNTVGFRSGFQRNGNNRGTKLLKEYRVKAHDRKDNEEMSVGKKVDCVKGNRGKWKKNYGARNYRSENSEAEIHGFKVNEKEQSSEKMEESEILDVPVKLDGSEVIDISGYQRQEGKVQEEGLNDTGMVVEKKVDGAKGYGKKLKKYYGARKYRSGVTAEIHGFKGNELEENSEKMEESEILEFGVKLGGLDVTDRNEYRRQDHKVREEGLDDTGLVVENRQDENREVDKAKDGEKVNAVDDRRNWNKSGNVGRKFRSSAFSDMRSGNMRSREETNVTGLRNFTRSERFGGWNKNWRDGEMVWMKK